MSGTTVTVAVVKEGWIHLGHVGDSRAILVRKIGTEIIPVVLTRDHKPHLAEEKSRIEQHGGVVKIMKHDGSSRVFCKRKNYPGLSMSRALGDQLS